MRMLSKILDGKEKSQNITKFILEEPLKTVGNVEEDSVLLAHLERMRSDMKPLEKSMLDKVADMQVVFKCSHLLNVGSVEEAMVEGQGYEEGDAIIAIDGILATERIVIDAIEDRMEEAVEMRKRVVSIQICNSPINSLKHSVCSVFHSKESSDLLNDLSVKAMRNCQSLYFLLDSNLLNLSVTFTNLQLLDSSINRFDKLLTLDLSRNQIVRIAGLIELPSLEYLDLSGNMLSSINFLENMRSLKSLILHHNCITELKDSVNMLVPLAKTLTVLDMSNNAVCRRIVMINLPKQTALFYFS